ncbi:STAS domain-containing protein [Candidatus Pacearchaeota archaeon]|nr:STAS domain-containing protein [Candidatus Pacearchaeota archaeon]
MCEQVTNPKYDTQARVLRFRDQKIMEDTNVQAMGRELFSLIEQGDYDYCLNFSNVDFLGNNALGKLITAEKKHKFSRESALVLTNIRPEIYEVFAITKLNRLFTIFDDVQDFISKYQAGWKPDYTISQTSRAHTL